MDKISNIVFYNSDYVTANRKDLQLDFDTLLKFSWKI